MKQLSALGAAVFVVLAASVNAVEAPKPGTSLWGIALGSSRAQAVALVQKKYVKARRQRTYTHAKGVVEDWWVIPGGAEESTFEVFSVRGKVVQLRSFTMDERGATNLSFAQLIRRYQLQKRVYGFADPQGPGHVGFYYDDVRRGICFTKGVQDTFLLTSRPDAIIVHRPGTSAMVIENGLRGKLETGRDGAVGGN